MTGETGGSGLRHVDGPSVVATTEVLARWRCEMKKTFLEAYVAKDCEWRAQTVLAVEKIRDADSNRKNVVQS